jgi:hypothetical protein
MFQYFKQTLHPYSRDLIVTLRDREEWHILEIEKSYGL